MPVSLTRRKSGGPMERPTEDEALSNVEAEQFCDALVHETTEGQFHVLLQRLMTGRRWSEIARDYGVSRQAILERRARGLKRIRRRMERKKDES